MVLGKWSLANRYQPLTFYDMVNIVNRILPRWKKSGANIQMRDNFLALCSKRSKIPHCQAIYVATGLGTRGVIM